MGPANKADMCFFIIKHTLLYISQSVVCHTQKTALKTIPLIHTYQQEAYVLTWNGMEPWSKGIRRCVWRFYLFIYNLFISEIFVNFFIVRSLRSQKMTSM